MDVRDLAPSLFALGELFTRTNTILNGEHVSVSLKVRATKPGSFELVLILGQMYQSATQFLTGGFITFSVNLLALTFGASSLFGLFKRLKGQEPTEIVERADGVTLKVGDIEVHVPTAVFRCWKDDQVKRLTQAVVLPLYKTGVDMMVIRKGSKQLEVISKQDAPSFTVENLTTVDQGTENILPALT
ncbi:MAG TPA: hypothetical protein VJ565_05260, partial [Dehalococcoidia bacterium]|nr:hypothetical protein [Dehalococcoidia bacterium]